MRLVVRIVELAEALRTYLDAGVIRGSKRKALVEVLQIATKNSWRPPFR